MYTEAAAGILFHDKCDRIYATLACILETHPISLERTALSGSSSLCC